MKQNYVSLLRLYLFSILSVAGLSFWFLIGFPFENHNESFAWVVQLQDRSFVDLLTKPIWPVASFRPLGTMTAWLGYHWTHASIYPQQLFNYFVAIGAWLLLFSATKAKKLFGFVALAVGGAFFSGYLYLFHLHGVFYSPLLLWVAFLLTQIDESHPKERTWLSGLFLLAVLSSLYHPFALLVFAAFVVGHFLTIWPKASVQQCFLDLLYILASILLIKLLVPAQENLILSLYTLRYNLQGLITSYALVEVNVALSAVAYGLCLLTLFTIPSLTLKWRLWFNGIVTLLAFLFWMLQLPLLLLWLTIVLLKVLLRREWYFVCLLLCTALLPAITATGSPTYTVFALMVATFSTVKDCVVFEEEERISNALAIAALVTVLLLVVLVSRGQRVPVVSRLVTPLLSEKEKTYQIKELLDWLAQSDEKISKVTLCQNGGSPTASPNAADRRYRPPTSQEYLDLYIDSINRAHIGQQEEDAAVFALCFGGEHIANAQLLYTVAGKESGEASILKFSPYPFRHPFQLSPLAGELGGINSCISP